MNRTLACRFGEDLGRSPAVEPINAAIAAAERVTNQDHLPPTR